jgi:iron complex outermembrane recepter protein
MSMKTMMGRVSLFAATALCASLSMPAFAQDAEESTDETSVDETDDKGIVVTGTLIRGTEVVGSQTISVGAEEIADKGANSTNELLGLIPQIANAFNGRFEGDPRGFSSGISITRPNLRSLPSANQTSGGLTLVLVDGMRPTPVGVNQASVDVDLIPSLVLAGVDVVTDGGSSLYGADAVAGVLNFRTLPKFDGIKMDANYGVGTTIKNYNVWDAGIIAGTSWDSGNAYISASHSRRDEIQNWEVDWSSGLVYNAAGVPSFSFTQCPSAVGTETRWFRFGPGAAQFTNNPAAPGAGTFPVGTPCDATSTATYSPRQKRTNVYGALSQQFGDNIDLRVTGYFSKRDTSFTSYPRGFTAAGSPINSGALVGAAFPAAPIGSITVIPGGTSFSFSVNNAYVNTPTRVGFETWGVTPELTINLGSEWQVRNSLHYGQSTNSQTFPGVDAVKAQCYISGCPGIAAGQLNPRFAGAASAAVIQDIINYENAQDTDQTQFIFRSIADGPLFALPGGDAKVAIGVEYQRNTAKSRLTAGTIGSINALPFDSFSRNAKSAFGEISLPITTFLDLSGSVRYDDYSDFGSTTNPSIGAVLKPTNWLKIFGHWNTSFNAPTAIDGLTIATGRFVCGIYVAGSTNAAQRPTDPLGRDTSRQGTCAMVLQGSGPGLQPQTAESWAVGFEATPYEGLRFGTNFYSIKIDNALGTLNPSNIATYTTNPNLYTYNISAAGYAALLATLTNGGQLGAQQPSSNIALVVDTRTSNLNAADLEGIDFNIDYSTSLGAGRLGVGIAGTRQTKAIVTFNGVAANQLGVGGPRSTVTSFVGYNDDIYSAKLTINYSGKFKDAATNNAGRVETVNPFITTNIMFGYKFPEEAGVLAGTSMRLIIDNIFEAEPQTIRRANTNNLSYNNFTLGRVIKFGISKTF